MFGKTRIIVLDIFCYITMVPPVWYQSFGQIHFATQAPAYVQCSPSFSAVGEGTQEKLRVSVSVLQAGLLENEPRCLNAPIIWLWVPNCFPQTFFHHKLSMSKTA